MCLQRCYFLGSPGRRSEGSHVRARSEGMIHGRRRVTRVQRGEISREKLEERNSFAEELGSGLQLNGLRRMEIRVPFIKLLWVNTTFAAPFPRNAGILGSSESTFTKLSIERF